MMTVNDRMKTTLYSIKTRLFDSPIPHPSPVLTEGKPRKRLQEVAYPGRTVDSMYFHSPILLCRCRV